MDDPESAVGSVTAITSCADNAKREYESLPQLLAFDNAKVKEIRSLDLTARSKDFKRQGSVTFGSWSDHIEVTLSAEDEKDISQAREELRDALDGAKAWYSTISRVDLPKMLLMSLLLLWLVTNITLGESSEPRRGVEFGRAVLLALQVLGVFGAIGLLCWFMWKIHARYFPRSFFALGQGVDRYQIDDNMRWVVIIGFVVSVFGSLVVAFVTG